MFLCTKKSELAKVKENDKRLGEQSEIYQTDVICLL